MFVFLISEFCLSGFLVFDDVVGFSFFVCCVVGGVLHLEVFGGFGFCWGWFGFGVCCVLFWVLGWCVVVVLVLVWLWVVCGVWFFCVVQGGGVYSMVSNER